MKKYIVSILGLILLNSCQLTEVDKKVLAEYKIRNGDRISIVYVGTGATTSEVIHVMSSKTKEPIQTFKHNYLHSSELINDTTLKLIIGDTTVYGPKLDTLSLHTMNLVKQLTIIF